MAEAGSERQCEGTRRGWGPPPIFLDLLILKKFKSSDFGTADSKEVSGANLGSTHSKGVRRLCALLMKYYTTIANYVNGKVQARAGTGEWQGNAADCGGPGEPRSLLRRRGAGRAGPGLAGRLALRWGRRGGLP